MLIKRESFLRVGMFDPNFRIGEMMDWVARADHAGLVTCTIDEIVLRRRIHGSNTVLKQQQSQADYLHALRASIVRKRATTEPAATGTTKNGRPK